MSPECLNCGCRAYYHFKGNKFQLYNNTYIQPPNSRMGGQPGFRVGHRSMAGNVSLKVNFLII